MSSGRSSPYPVTIAFAHRGHNWITGAEQCLLDLVARLDPARFRSVVLCEQPALASAVATLGVPVVRINDDWGVGAARPGLARVRTHLADVFREHEVGLVHANMTATLPALIPAARRQPVPVVAHLHLPVTGEYERLHEFVHQADIAVGVARHVIAPLQADGVAASRLRVIYNGVDTDRLGRGDASRLRTSLGIAPSTVVATAVGSLIHRKAHDVTLRGIAAARSRGVDVHLLVCGTGEEDSALRARSAALGIASHVHFLGYRSDVGAIIRAATDIFVTSAREEMMPLNVLEAQWLGVPIIASDIPAHREALAADVSGVLVPLDDPVALAHAIGELAVSPARRAALGAAGPGVVAGRFTMEQYVSAFSALYGELVARPRSDYGWLRATAWPPIYTAHARRVVRRRLARALRAIGVEPVDAVHV